jgi:hypothetical protein
MCRDVIQASLSSPQAISKNHAFFALAQSFRHALPLRRSHLTLYGGRKKWLNS